MCSGIMGSLLKSTLSVDDVLNHQNDHLMKKKNVYILPEAKKKKKGAYAYYMVMRCHDLPRLEFNYPE